jgi:hypothetical protein
MTPRAPLRRRAESGQAMVEYLVVAALLIALVAVPIEGDNSVIDMLIKAIHSAYTRFLAAISIPM